MYVSLPNGLHHQWTMRALAAGKYVLCEKPYSRHPAEVEEAFALAERLSASCSRRRSCTGTIPRRPSSPASSRMGRSALRASSRPRSASCSRAWTTCADAALDGGALMDLGCYCVSTIRLLGGEPESVAGRAGRRHDRCGHVVRGRAPVFRAVPPGASGARSPTRGTRSSWSSGRMDACGSAPWRVDWGGDVPRAGRRGDARRRLDADSYVRQLANFADAAAGVAPALLGREDALGQARAIDALYRSAAEGGAVESQPGLGTARERQERPRRDGGPDALEEEEPPLSLEVRETERPRRPRG